MMLVVYCVTSVAEVDIVLNLGQYAEQNLIGVLGASGDNATIMLEK